MQCPTSPVLFAFVEERHSFEDRPCNAKQGGDAGVKDGERCDFDGGGRREGGDLNQFSERTEGGGVH